MTDKNILTPKTFIVMHITKPLLRFSMISFLSVALDLTIHDNDYIWRPLQRKRAFFTDICSLKEQAKYAF